MKPTRTIGVALVLWSMLWVLPAVHGDRHAWKSLGIPLLGTCPVDPNSRVINGHYFQGSAFNDKVAEIWLVVAGAGFAVLALYGLIRNSRRAARAFMLLFLVSTFLTIVRFVMTDYE